MNFTGTIPAGAVAPDGTVVGSNTGMTNSNIAGTPDVLLEPQIVCNPASGLHAPSGSFGQFMNASCFAPPTIGHNGAYEWPYMKGPAFMNNDLSLFKNFKISESKKFQFRVEAYNFLNHPIPSFLSGDPGLNLNFDSSGKVTNPIFGTATNKLGHRVIQLAAKFYF